MLVSLSELEFVSGELAARDSKGTAAGPRSPLDARVSLGQLSAVQLTAEYASPDPGLAAFLRSDTEHAYYLCWLGCTLRPSRFVVFESAWVMCRLESSTAAGDGPIAVAMDPLRLSNPIEISSQAEVGIDAKVGHLKLGRSGKETGDVAFLEALNLFESDPSWEFRKTKTVALSGTYLLQMVVKAGRRDVVTGTVELTANVRLKDAPFMTAARGLFREKPSIAFALPSPAA